MAENSLSGGKSQWELKKDWSFISIEQSSRLRTGRLGKWVGRWGICGGGGKGDLHPCDGFSLVGNPILKYQILCNGVVAAKDLVCSCWDGIMGLRINVSYMVQGLVVIC